MISVIVPVYNAKKYLKRCIYSILRNIYFNLEVLCIDGGSTGNSEEILQEISKDSSRLKVFIHSKSGVAVTMNHALDKVTGKFVSFVDADGWIYKNDFEYLLKACSI